MKRLTLLLVILFSLCLCSCKATADTTEPLIENPPSQDNTETTEIGIPDVSDIEEEAPAIPDDPSDEADSLSSKRVILYSDDYLNCLQDSDFVLVQAFIPDICIELAYATEHNFTNQIIYDFHDAYLRYGTVKKLINVADSLRSQGYALKIWDAYRPVSSQFALWDVCPDPVYVADPTTSYSKHSCGNTVDISIAKLDGTDIEMPTAFDDFSELANRDYSDCTEEAKNNALLLENEMIKAGFSAYYGEWWHFTDTNSYDIEKTFDPSTAAPSYSVDLLQSYFQEYNSSQLLCVACHDSYANISYFTLGSYNIPLLHFSTTGRIGKNGLGKTQEGDKKTPSGVYHVTKAFGICQDPGSCLPYHQLEDIDYWVDDSNSVYYNQFVTLDNVVPDWSSAEHLITVSGRYNYVLSLDYNPTNKPNLGSAIFIHCLGDTYTSGCIALPESYMIQLVQSLNADSCVMIQDISHFICQ